MNIPQKTSCSVQPALGVVQNFHHPILQPLTTWDHWNLYSLQWNEIKNLILSCTDPILSARHVGSGYHTVQHRHRAFSHHSVPRDSAVLRQGLANSRLPALRPLVWMILSAHSHTICLHITNGCFPPQDSRAAVRPPKPKIFTIWIFAEKHLRSPALNQQSSIHQPVSWRLCCGPGLIVGTGKTAVNKLDRYVLGLTQVMWSDGENTLHLLNYFPVSLPNVVKLYISGSTRILGDN